ncbi:hypothetical protein N7466_000179 [Penicillium verhagenii]|uniref:uncharacterized protein n=1 Tax=Penicillium verhagenii TaxID=1562060 RepID=UPI00254560B4|nr:uncharacterized protein N7466_000179 [Penicillium verhagenii]KAJ5947164.1 hypothetical protein N7466_000179 [Penicillium verhagenii]
MIILITDALASLLWLLLAILTVWVLLLLHRVADFYDPTHLRSLVPLDDLPPNLPPAQYAKFLATLRADQKRLNIQQRRSQRQIYVEPWKPFQPFEDFFFSFCTWVLTGAVWLLKTTLRAAWPVSPWLFPTVIFVVEVFLFITVVLLVTLFILGTAAVTMVRERQKQQRIRRHLVVEIPPLPRSRDGHVITTPSSEGSLKPRHRDRKRYRVSSW